MNTNLLWVRRVSEKSACAILGVTLLLWGGTSDAQRAPGPQRVFESSTPLIGDFDGDGRPDLATWNDADKKWSILLNCGNGFRHAVEWDGMWGTDGTAYVADLNGDGKADIIMWDNDVHQWSVNLSTGSGFNPARWSGLWGTDGAIHIADLNGDGKADVIMWDNDVKKWSVNLSTGKSFTPARWDGLWGTDGLIHIADMNGDGKADVIMWDNDVKQWSVNLSTGKSFKPQRWSGAWGTAGDIRLADLNGDKKTDVIMWNGPSRKWVVNLSTGKNFKQESWDGAWGTDGVAYFADVNGDKKADVIMWYDAGKQWSINLSTGHGFNAERWAGNGSDSGRFYVVDLNKDKKADVLIWQSSQSAWIANLSNGKSWITGMWREDPAPPNITQFQVDPKVLHKGDPAIVDYAVSTSDDCQIDLTVYETNASGQGSGKTIWHGSDPSGVISIDPNANYPLYLVMVATCDNDGCEKGSSHSNVIEVDGPPQLKINSYTASGGGINVEVGDSQNLYVTAGTPVKLSWNVVNCGDGCNVAVQGMNGDVNSAATVFLKQGLPTTWTINVPVPPNDEKTTWWLAASDTGEPIRSAHIEVDLAPLPQEDPCTNQKCSWHYYELFDPDTDSCFNTVMEYGTDVTAKEKAQATAANYKVIPITIDQFFDGCSALQ